MLEDTVEGVARRQHGSGHEDAVARDEVDALGDPGRLDIGRGDPWPCPVETSSRVLDEVLVVALGAGDHRIGEPHGGERVPLGQQQRERVLVEHDVVVEPEVQGRGRGR